MFVSEQVNIGAIFYFFILDFGQIKRKSEAEAIHSNGMSCWRGFLEQFSNECRKMKNTKHTDNPVNQSQSK